jgi:hypothetical protein
VVSPESTFPAAGAVKSKIVSCGVTALDVAAGPVPIAFVAVTLNVYAVPFVNPVIVAEVADAPAGTDVPAVDPAYGVTVYPVIALPPLPAGADQLTSAWLVAGLAVTLCGAVGAVGPVGVTGLDAADTSPWPPELDA